MIIKHKKLSPLFLAFALVLGNLMFASMASAAGSSSYFHASQDTTDADMLADALLVRPLMLVGTVLGAATFVVTLPLSLLGRNTGRAGKALFVEPAKRTFVHPLGDL